jgi:hypothetical protein
MHAQKHERSERAAFELTGAAAGSLVGRLTAPSTSSCPLTDKDTRDSLESREWRLNGQRWHLAVCWDHHGGISGTCTATTTTIADIIARVDHTFVQLEHQSRRPEEDPAVRPSVAENAPSLRVSRVTCGVAASSCTPQ